MSKRITTEIFIERATAIHGDFYDYSKVDYKGTNEKVIIICPVHGEFEQQSYGHSITGYGCKDCGRGKKTTKQFIEKAKEIHGEKYNYSKSEYIGRTSKVKIICPEHGVFEQTPEIHFKGSGCRKCSDKNKGQTQVLSVEEFKERAEKIHGDRYNYSLVDNTKGKVEIICKEHGSFEQKPIYHTRGQGCPKCANEIRGKSYRKTTESFIEEAIEVHGDTYDYSLVDYNITSDKIKIVCKKHGEFKQRPKGHLSGRGCRKCWNESSDNWSAKKWKKAGERSKFFDSFKVYIIRCFTDEEEFYKIGKTFKTVKNRFVGNKNMPYEYEVVKLFKGEPKFITDLENKLQRLNRDSRYTPNMFFKGHTECFKKVDIDV